MRKIFIIGIFISISCNTNYINTIRHSNEVYVDNFPKQIRCKADPLNVSIDGIEELIIADTFLIACNHRAIFGGFLKVYSINRNKYLGTLIQSGRGPNELLTVTYNHQNFTDSSGCHIWFSDWGFININYLININKSLSSNTNKLIVDKKIILPNYYMGYGMFFKNDTVISFPFMKKNDTNINYVEYNKSNKEEVFNTHLYKYKFNINSNLNYIYKLNIITNFNVSRFVAYNSRLSRIIFFSRRIRNVKLLNVNNITYEKSLSNNEDSRLPRYYYDVCTSKKYVFALYLNKTNRQIFNSNSKGVEVHVFDWEGRPIAKYIIPNNLIQIEYYEKGKELYGLTNNETIYKYKIEL